MTTDGTRTVTLISLLRHTAQLMVSELIERLAAAGYADLPAAAHPVLENIDREGTRLTDLAARADMTHQSMGELIDTLEQRGYLERQADPTDGRARLICLTAKGKQMARVALREIAAIEANWSQAWRAAGLRADLRAVLEHALPQAPAPATPRRPTKAKAARTASRTRG